jgi:hypothetical protein
LTETASRKKFRTQDFLWQNWVPERRKLTVFSPDLELQHFLLDSGSVKFENPYSTEEKNR